MTEKMTLGSQSCLISFLPLAMQICHGSAQTGRASLEQTGEERTTLEPHYPR